MTANHDFERQLGAWLREDSARRVPDHLTEVLVQTVATRQRPWWWSATRWLPFDAASRVRTISIVRRPILILAILALVIAALLIVAIGSRRQVPPPFGPARNGVLLASANGDISTIDPKTGVATPLIIGPSLDFGPMFSRDGTKFLFLRGVGNGLALAVANADGGDVRVVTPAVDGLDWVDWSPDGVRIAYLSTPPGTTGHRINLVNVDGTDPRQLDVGQSANQLSWLPPNGSEILFRGDGNPLPGIFAVHPDGTDLRPISTRPALDIHDYNDLAVSPDGTLVAYRYVAPDEPFDIHVLNLATGKDQELPEAPGSAGEGGPAFSPDGRSILYLRWAADSSTQLVVVPADGSDFGTAIGPSGPLGSDGPTINNYGFTPDGAAVFANYDDEKLARLLPIDGSPGIVIARGELALPSYQRLAP